MYYYFETMFRLWLNAHILDFILLFTSDRWFIITKFQKHSGNLRYPKKGFNDTLSLTRNNQANIWSIYNKQCI